MSKTNGVPSISWATRSAASRFLSATSTFMSRAKRRQIALPMAPPPPVTRTVFTAASFRPSIDDALRLADGALDRADLHVGADADVGLDRVLQARGGRSVAFHHYGEVVHRSLLGELQDVVRSEAGLLEDQLLDL